MTSTKKRSWRPVHINTIDPPPGGYEAYQSYQKIINSNNGQIDNEKLEEHIEMMMNDDRFNWEEIPVDFSLVKPGDRVRYTTLNQKGEHLFRTGGWITAVDKGATWLAYMSHTRSSWCLQAEDCQRLWIIKKVIAKPKELIYKFTRPGPKTNFNSYLIDDDGVEQRVGSFPSTQAKNKFEATNKFNKAKSGDIRWVFRT